MNTEEYVEFNPKELLTELDSLILHSFMFDKIVNKLKIIDPTQDERCQFTKEELSQWKDEQGFEQIALLFLSVKDIIEE